jgi:hypothetical protein
MFQKLFTRLIFPNSLKIHNFDKDKSIDKKLVLITGFGGSSQRNFNKLVNYYTNREFAVVTFIMPLAVPLFVRDILENRLFSTISQMKMKNLYVHSFSNNGIWVIGSLLKQQSLPKIQRIVIDSAPAFYYEELKIDDEVNILSRVLVSVILNGPTYTHPFYTPITKTLLFSILYGSKFFTTIEKIFFPVIQLKFVPKFIDLNYYIKDNFPIIPTLFIYSNDDNLVSKEYIVDFISKIKPKFIDNNSALLQEFSVDKVPHVGIFYHRNKEYQELLDKFFP